ncbi:hypothetical protein [Salinibacter grassmerensis]|uniref:hypothetical protein n=1 Tax=Salinibacter grassmerensis TaxID=3040353 RepID=UPI0021E6FA54|nr:hypothetical protein [Salinibacter grassmerensis]
MPTDDEYEQTRRRFDELEVEQQAQFLIEASASALARGIEQAGKALADGLQDVVRRPHRSSCTSQTSGPGAAEPETAQRQAPKGGRTSDDA